VGEQTEGPVRRLWRWWQERRANARLAKEWGVTPEFIAALRGRPVYVPRKNVIIMDLKGDG
jgi:hypothetical protein